MSTFEMSTSESASTAQISNKLGDVSRDDDSKMPECEINLVQQTICKKSSSAAPSSSLLAGKVESEESPGSEEEEENENGGQEQHTMSIRAAAIKNELVSHAPIVDAVVLSANGDIQQIKYDGTPSLRQAKAILGGSTSIVGGYSQLGVVVVRASDAAGAEMNQHSLPSPLQNENHAGDYLLYRADANGVSADFTAQEFSSLSESQDSCGSSAQQNTQYTSALSDLKEELSEDVKDSFLESFGRAPDSAELSSSVDATIASLIEALLEEDDTEESDPSYSPEDEGKYDFEQYVSDADEEESEVDYHNEEFAAALDHISQLGRIDGESLASSIADTYVEINGCEPSLDELSTIFSRIQETFQIEAEEDAKESAILQAYAEDNGAFGADIDAFKQEFDEALAVVSALGSEHGQQFANVVADEFVEVNGREPELEELQSIYARISSSLAEEAEADQLESSADDDEEEEDSDEDYNPNNPVDEILEECDEAADAAFENNSDFESEADSASEEDDDDDE